MADPPRLPRPDRRRALLVALGLAVATIALLALIATAVPFPESGVDPPSNPDPSPPQHPEEEPVDLPGFDIPYNLLRNLFLAAIGLLCIGAVLVVYRLRTGTTPTPSDQRRDQPPTESGERTPVEAVADTAGETARRLRDQSPTTFENEIYRAWRGMTNAVTVSNPDATTPNEFATRAIQAGMDENDVAELTHLFETVRYGDADPTQETERRAVELLERIDATYGGDEA